MPVLIAIVILSLAARVAWLGAPCRGGCHGLRGHVLIFDEKYYVQAARVIAGIRPPADGHYADAPLGVDPNAEHPQLVKVLMAGSIELLGDGPLAWRWLSLVAGTLVLIGVYALVRAAGGGAWTAVAAAAILALDDLTLVAGRIGTLDIPAVAAMVWAVWLYLRQRPLVAGALLGVGACAKEVALLALPVIVLADWLGGSGMRWRRVAACSGVAVAVFVALLWVLGLIAQPYDGAAHRLLGTDPLTHLWHILAYGAALTSPHGPQGIASYPWAWLIDLRPIVYLSVDPAHPSPGLVGVTPPVHFLGVISPPIVLLGIPWLAWRLLAVALRRARGRAGALARAHPPGPVGALALAWFLGTWTPLALASALDKRTSYLYYMILVMPALALACAEALSRVPQVVRRPLAARRLALAWWATLVAAGIVLYPLTPLPGYGL